MKLNPRRIEEARLAANMSRGDLAFAVRSISDGEIKAENQHIRRWEKGLNEPGATAIACIAKATGKDIEFFYESGGDDELDEEAALRRAGRSMGSDLLERAIQKRVDEEVARRLRNRS